jgi:hypothetical protein
MAACGQSVPRLVDQTRLKISRPLFAVGSILPIVSNPHLISNDARQNNLQTMKLERCQPTLNSWLNQAIYRRRVEKTILCDVQKRLC